MRFKKKIVYFTSGVLSKMNHETPYPESKQRCRKYGGYKILNPDGKRSARRALMGVCKCTICSRHITSGTCKIEHGHYLYKGCQPCCQPLRGFACGSCNVLDGKVFTSFLQKIGKTRKEAMNLELSEEDLDLYADMLTERFSEKGKRVVVNFKDYVRGIEFAKLL